MCSHKAAVRKGRIVKVCASEHAIREIEIFENGVFSAHISEVGMLMSGPFEGMLKVHFAVSAFAVLDRSVPGFGEAASSQTEVAGVALDAVAAFPEASVHMLSER